MEIIDLSQAHPYREDKIVDHKKVKHTDGREYTQITYQQDSSLISFIMKVALGVFLSAYLLPVELYLVGCFVAGIIAAATQEERKVNVLSTTSLEDHLWNRIRLAPSINQLFWRAKGEQPKIFLSLVPRKTMEHELPRGSNGCAYLNTGKLVSTLGRTEDEILSTVVFELGNFAQRTAFNRVEERARSADEFAEETERVEFETMVIHHKAVSQAVKNNNWDPSMDKYEESLECWKNFAGFWRERKNHPHAESYRDDWRKWYGDRGVVTA